MIFPSKNGKFQKTENFVYLLNNFIFPNFFDVLLLFLKNFVSKIEIGIHRMYLLAFCKIFDYNIFLEAPIDANFPGFFIRDRIIAMSIISQFVKG